MPLKGFGAFVTQKWEEGLVLYSVNLSLKWNGIDKKSESASSPLRIRLESAYDPTRDFGARPRFLIFFQKFKYIASSSHAKKVLTLSFMGAFNPINISTIIKECARLLSLTQLECNLCLRNRYAGNFVSMGSETVIKLFRYTCAFVCKNFCSFHKKIH
ncbi:MAG: hypothetical protein A4S09_13505 [Proteobacteria bacterium SG_bin7]|nr:MAG: hypothetical protein A4S09_13505 [Proteobacteria bacterium SG_bin7]